METAAEQQVTKTIDYFQEIWPALKVWGINLLVTLLILIIGLYLIKAVMKALDKAARQANADVTLARFMHSFVNIALYILLIFIVAGQLGINTASILAVLGTAGLAIAMSLKDSLSHFAGGILILFLRPFKVGDYIICSEGEGTIQEIGLVYTRVLTKDNKGLTIPNGKLAGISVTNASRMPERRLDITVGVSYDADLKKAKEIIENVYRECPYFVSSMDLQVFVEELASSSVDLGACGYVNGPDYLSARRYVMENIKLQFDAAGIEIPFPQVVVHQAETPPA
ncbi:MAG: mechanosensitive ion channel family protein [Lachnospiraceae bacterium]|jgi:small conductance mechanosensitive channel|nr:mechanosensitive ion channel family protein [Lachnospiraceae bacterium]